MQLAWMKPCSFTGRRYAGQESPLACLCSLVPSGRLLHPTTNFKIQLIRNLCVSWLSKKCRDLRSTKQICPVSGISEHWGVAFNCSIRFNNNNNNLNKNWWLYIRYFLWNGLCRNTFSVLTPNSVRYYSKQRNVTAATVCATVHVQRTACKQRHLVKVTSHIPKPVSPRECLTKQPTYKNATWEFSCEKHK